MFKYSIYVYHQTMLIPLSKHMHAHYMRHVHIHACLCHVFVGTCTALRKKIDGAIKCCQQDPKNLVRTGFIQRKHSYL